MPDHTTTSTLIFTFILACLPLPATADEAIPVFVLAGQSNMVGAGEVEARPGRNGGSGSLAWLVEESPDKARFAHLQDENGAWSERDDV